MQRNYFYAGAGDGTFLTPVEIPLKSSDDERGGAAGLADFNKDGIPDLLVQYKYQIGVALGKGDGSFEVGWTTARNIQRAFSGGVVGDFDGDGMQDFAAIGSHGGIGHVSIFFGSADGTFSQVDQSYFVDQLSAADINGDGKTEITQVAFQGSDPEPLYPSFAILEIDADRTFSYSYAVGVDPIYYGVFNVVIDDFNGDGIADAAIVGDPFYDGLDVSLLLLGSTAGSFTQASRSRIRGLPRALLGAVTFAAADFDGDGLPDLAATGTQADTNYPAYGVLLTRAGQTGVASIRPPAGAGAHSVVARYSGDDNFLTSVSKPVSLKAPGANTPVVSLSSTTLQFGEQPVSEPSNAKTVVLTNAGTGSLSISDISIKLEDPSFDTRSFATSNTCPTTLAVGASCKIRVRFVPGSTGSKEKLLAITDNAGNSPQEITLSGVGVKHQ